MRLPARAAFWAPDWPVVDRPEPPGHEAGGPAWPEPGRGAVTVLELAAASGRTTEAVKAGMAAGVVGVGCFLVLHHLWIAPIWFVAPAGLVLALGGGAATGAAYGELRPNLPRRPWTSPAVMAGVAGILAPAVVIGQIRGPLFALNATGGGDLLVPPVTALLDVLVGLVGSSVLAGAALGWMVGRSRRAAATTALAALAIALGPGHNIPLLGGTPVVAKELVILAAVCAVSSITLVEGEALARRRQADRHGRTP
jgi:hypothetical protein